MVPATRTSAPNTSLAVIRPKPRPDSPTASEISVIMLKSELPHEASNPVSKKAARLHHAPGGRSGVAARGARAATPPGDRIPAPRVSRAVDADECLWEGFERGRPHRGPKRSDRRPRGGWLLRSVAGSSGRVGGTSGRSYCR